MPFLLADADPAVRYYAVIMTGLLKLTAHAATLQAIAAAQNQPVYLRKEAYQALGNLADGDQVEFLRLARQRDPACAVEIRDVLRALKRQRIEPQR